MIDYIEKLLIKIFSRKITRIEHLEKYNKEGNTIDSIVIIHYSLFWFNVVEHFSKEHNSNQDLSSFSLSTTWELKN